MEVVLGSGEVICFLDYFPYRTCGLAHQDKRSSSVGRGGRESYGEVKFVVCSYAEEFTLAVRGEVVFL